MNIPVFRDQRVRLARAPAPWFAPVLGVKTARQIENANNYRRNRAAILALKKKQRRARR